MFLNKDMQTIEIEIAKNTALQMIGSMLSNPNHTFKIIPYLLYGDEKVQFTNSYLKLASNTNTFNEHLKNRLIALSERVNEATAILIVGLKNFAQPQGVDCQLCGFASCNEFYNFMNAKNPGKKVLCTVECMAFSSSVTKGMNTAIQLNISNVLTHSLGAAALNLKLIQADFAVGIILEIGKSVATGKENKMKLNFKKI